MIPLTPSSAVSLLANEPNTAARPSASRLREEANLTDNLTLCN